ncbi:MAG: hypothetical protein L6437_15760 [Kiritimatiellae bacterium]|nr:hypothetical protein [Verrucomicrobiota bacterium]MBU4366942.1 hypothetical protein [Verrucomicrobiota bacterium]MCG2661688.1 hypothetical protein [Kiritimatiellia bacterium]
MNLQVDFMLDTERRSGSTVSQKFVIRLAAFIIPVIVLGLFVVLIFTYQSSKRDRNLVEQEKIQIDPEYKKVLNLERELKNVQDLKTAIQGWSDSRLDAYRLLRGLQSAVPRTIQLTQWILNEKVEAVGTVFGRTAGIYMKGKVAGERPAADVQLLYQALKSEPPFPDIMAQIEVKRFAASEALDEQGGRVFDIECMLKPRLLVQPVSPASKPK